MVDLTMGLGGLQVYKVQLKEASSFCALKSTTSFTPGQCFLWASLGQWLTVSRILRQIAPWETLDSSDGWPLVWGLPETSWECREVWHASGQFLLLFSFPWAQTCITAWQFQLSLVPSPSSLSFFLFLLYICLVVPGLSCGTWDLELWFVAS